MIARSSHGKVPRLGPSALSRLDPIRSWIEQSGADRLDWNHVQVGFSQEVRVIQRRLAVRDG